MTQVTIQKETCARIPTDVGQFQLCLYVSNQDQKEHLALVMGHVAHEENVLVRVHSECFTGDVLGSLRCDCGPQLQRAMQAIAENGTGIIIYLRQEGRGIGLLEKLRAYNLQDVGYDTVDANLMLGHQADARDYTIAALILRDLQVKSVRLLTNNPDKIESLEQQGIPVTARVPLTTRVTPENRTYLLTKVQRMRHLLNLEAAPGRNGDNGRVTLPAAVTTAVQPAPPPSGRPFITLSYAQSLDGSITARRGQPMALSGPQSMAFCHHLRAQHDAILVGINTVLADDPRLTVRLVGGPNPQPIVLDSNLRYPLTANLSQHPDHQPWIATTVSAKAPRWQELQSSGAHLFSLPADGRGRVDLPALLTQLSERGVQSVMVEGGARVITSFLDLHLVDRVAITIAPLLVGGLHAVESVVWHNGRLSPHLRAPHYHTLGQDIVLIADVDWEAS
ncbi:MAG: GTP cyclohydrolase II [Ardenticatenaceae bacterium]|nr:GTP cyclohydrolase II [Ardenticatenaceae bacterium]